MVTLNKAITNFQMLCGRESPMCFEAKSSFFQLLLSFPSHTTLVNYDQGHTEHLISHESILFELMTCSYVW